MTFCGEYGLWITEKNSSKSNAIFSGIKQPPRFLMSHFSDYQAVTLYKSIQNQEKSLINHCLGQVYSWNRDYKNKPTWKNKFHIVSFLYGSSTGLFKRICHVSSNWTLAFRWCCEEGCTGTMTRPWGISALPSQASENCLNLLSSPVVRTHFVILPWAAAATSRSRCPSPDSNLALGLGLPQLQNHRNIFPLFCNMLQYFEIALYVNLGDVSTLGGFDIRKSYVSSNSYH